MERMKKNKFIDSRIWILAYSKTRDFVNAENAGGVSVDKILGRTFGDMYDRDHFVRQYHHNEIGTGRDLHLLGTNN